MSTEINCPNCGQTVQPQTRFCEHCGVDLAMAVALAEQEALLPIQPVNGLPIAPEVLVPRIGEYMTKRHLIRPEDLKRALNYQKEQIKMGSPILLGQAMLELGMVDRETLDQVVTAQILELQNALSEANRTLKQRVLERTLELQRALERLSELNVLKANFVSNISHELRTPLTHIKGYLNLFAEGELGPLNQAQLDGVNVIMRAEERLERLIEDLIQFSLVSRGSLNLDLHIVDIDKLIKNNIDRISPKAQMHGIIISANLADDLTPVWADEDKINWVLLQLLDNAVKFTPKDGKVVVNASNNLGLVSISVTDTGIGIPEERIPEIFEPFHQLDGSATRRFGGTGLGLTMVRRIIEAHSSQVRVASVVGEGSYFEFTLPSFDQSKHKIAGRESSLTQ
jgi:signal transduction histidine kinase